MNSAVILIPAEGNNVNLQTNGVNAITILNAMKNLSQILAQELLKDARHAVGDNPAAQEKYLDKLCKAAEKGEDDMRGKDLLNLN